MLIFPGVSPQTVSFFGIGGQAASAKKARIASSFRCLGSVSVPFEHPTVSHPTNPPERWVGKNSGRHQAKQKSFFKGNHGNFSHFSTESQEICHIFHGNHATLQFYLHDVLPEEVNLRSCNGKLESKSIFSGEMTMGPLIVIQYDWVGLYQIGSISPYKTQTRKDFCTQLC